MRRSSTISWTSIDDDDDHDVAAEVQPTERADVEANDGFVAFPIPASPAREWDKLCGKVRDGIAELARSPVLQADGDASAIFVALADDPSPDALDAALDGLLQRVDAIAAERAARFRPATRRVASTAEPMNLRTAGGRRMLRL